MLSVRLIGLLIEQFVSKWMIYVNKTYLLIWTNPSKQLYEVQMNDVQNTSVRASI